MFKNQTKQFEELNFESALPRVNCLSCYITISFWSMSNSVLKTSLQKQLVWNDLFKLIYRHKHNPITKNNLTTKGLFGLAYLSLSTGISMCETIWEKLWKPKWVINDNENKIDNFLNKLKTMIIFIRRSLNQKEFWIGTRRFKKKKLRCSSSTTTVLLSWSKMYLIKKKLSH